MPSQDIGLRRSRSSVDRALQLLRLLTEQPAGATLEEVAAAAGAPKASVHRSLQALLSAGFISQDGRRGRYRIGSELLRLVFTYYESWDEQAAVRPALERIAHLTGETAHYGRLDASEVIYIAKVTPPGESHRTLSRIGSRTPAHCSGLGKALLSQHLPTQRDVATYIETFGPLDRRTPNTATDAGSLHRELEDARRRGFALDREEGEPGITCLAFPVYLVSTTQPTGAISVSSLTHRTPLDDLIKQAESVKQAVEEELPGSTRSPNQGGVALDPR